MYLIVTLDLVGELISHISGEKPGVAQRNGQMFYVTQRVSRGASGPWPGSLAPQSTLLTTPSWKPWTRTRNAMQGPHGVLAIYMYLGWGRRSSVLQTEIKLKLSSYTSVKRIMGEGDPLTQERPRGESPEGREDCERHAPKFRHRG